MKKVLSVFLAFLLMFSLASCSSGEKEARQTAVNFLNAFMDFDFETMCLYVDDVTELQETTEMMKYDSIVENLPEEIQAFSDDFEEIYEIAFEKIRECMSYTIKDLRKDGDDYVFVVDITGVSQSQDIEGIITESFDEETMTEFTMEMLSSGKITVSMTEEEMMEVIIPGIIEMMKPIIEGIEFETETAQQDLVVSKTNGKWLVNGEKSDF